MEKQYSPSLKEKKMNKDNKLKSSETPVAEDKKNTKMEETNKNPEKKKTEKKELKTKETAHVVAESLRVSSKYCFAICRAIKGKSPEEAITFLERVINKKKSLQMKGREVAHQKSRGEKGIAGGRYPREASLEIINLLKQLRANADVNLIDNPVIVKAVANIGSRPFRRSRTRAKRTHIYIEVKDKTKLNSLKKQ